MMDKEVKKKVKDRIIDTIIDIVFIYILYVSNYFCSSTVDNGYRRVFVQVVLYFPFCSRDALRKYKAFIRFASFRADVSQGIVRLNDVDVCRCFC